MDRYWRRRLGRHLLLATTVIALVVGAAMVLAPADVIWRVSVTSGWISAVLLAVTLLLGPLNVIRARPNPVSFDLRRDLGIWAAVLAILHTMVGLFVHLRGRPLRYFVWDRPAAHHVPVRYDAFGVANWIGLGAAVVLLLLAVISNDVMLRRLGTARWKRIQRWGYWGAAAVVLHGLIYQVAVEKRAASLVLVFVLLIVGTTIAQLLGFRRVRRLARGLPEA